MKLYNALTNTIEEFKSIHPKQVNMYVCGPTVYDYAHIGNARPIVVFDTLAKLFRVLGYDVEVVSNFTDVDDKIIQKAKQEGVDEKVVTTRYIEAYNQVREMLHAQLPDRTPRVTASMDEIIDFISQLEQRDYAYSIDGDVYFRVSKVSNYGVLSKQRIEDLLVGARIHENDKKENPLDFTLWKATQEGVKWGSPWSEGRPGWHTECVVMIQKEFNEPLIDIHGGGMDLKFPHHENEIAQAQALHQSHLANYWIHNGMVNIDGEKMSKSLGNVVWAKDFIAKLGGNVVRWLLLSTHYRAPLSISEETIETAQKEYERVVISLKQAYVMMQLAHKEISNEIDSLLFDPFIEAMEDDLNTQNAFMALFQAVKVLNQEVRQRSVNYQNVGKVLFTIEKILYVLGIDVNRIQLHKDDYELFAKWNEAKQAKHFEIADQFRKELMSKGLL